MAKLYENKRKPKREGRKVTVGRVADVPPGRGATVKLKDGSELALFNVNDKFYAIENFCPHKAYPLADSRLHGNTVKCDLHGWRFDVRSGVCLTKKNCSIEGYEVVVEDDWIKILI
jgi:nitrite reductase/ring-hydroxylating ferredoxin subunit